MRRFLYSNPLGTLACILFACFFGLFIINACRKIHHQEDADLKNASIVRTKFFTVPANTHPLVKAIAQSIKNQDIEQGFVPELVRNAGYAIWNKAMVASGEASSNYRVNGGGTNLGQLIYIPFVLENKYSTNALLIVKTSLVDTFYRLFYGTSYAALGFGAPQAGHWNAADLFHTFLTFDNEMFGYTKFLVKDKRIIPSLYEKGDTTGDAITVELQGTDQNFKLTQGISCHPITVCGLCAFRTTESYRCCNPTTELYCTSYWYDDGSGGVTPPIGGGGGSSGGWQDPCRPIPGNNNPCGSNDSTNVPGWVPVDIEEPFGAAFFPNWEVSAENFLKIKHWLRNNIDTSGLDSCRRLILRKLIGKIGDSPIGLLLTNLDEAIGGPSTIDKFKVNFVTKPLTNKHGSTEYPTYDPVNHEFEVDIVLDSAIAKDATELYIANTLIHELVHAYMIYIWRKVNSGATATQLDSLSYTHAFNSYIDTLLKKDSLNPNLYLLSEPYHHNYMADQLLDFMASLLENFDSGGINNKKYYWYMAWSGLVRPQVKTWKRHWPNHPNWPPSNPSPSEDSTRGLKYALTLARIDSIYNTVLENESKSLSGALGRKPVSGGCY